MLKKTALGASCGCPYVTSPQQSGERKIQQDLLTMLAIVGQYTLDKQKRPHSLDDLVVAGYLKEVPTDPTTRRKDTWSAA
jgi:general secretion pathway protein G